VTKYVIGSIVCWWHSGTPSTCDILNGLTLLADCTAAVKQWYLVNGLLLNANKSEAICLGMPSQLWSATDTVTIAGTMLPVSEEICSLGVTINRRVTFKSHISAVVKSCNYCLRALQHICHLLPFSTAQTLDCSLILSRLDYGNAVLYSCSARAIGQLQCVVYRTMWQVLWQSNRYMPSQPLLRSLHWLPVQQRLAYKAALITYKVVTTSTASRLSDLLAVHIFAGPTRHLSTHPLLTVPYVASNFARRSFCFVSQTVWNSLPSGVQFSPSQATFKSRLKTHLFNISNIDFNDQPNLWCYITSSAPQDLWNWHLARYRLDYCYYYYCANTIYLFIYLFICSSTHIMYNQTRVRAGQQGTNMHW